MAATPLSPHPPTSTEIALPDAVFDRLFQRYTIKLRRAGLECFIVASIMFDLWVICVPQGQSWISMGFTLGFLVANVLTVILLRVFKRSEYSEIIYEVSPYVAWLVATMQLCFHLFFKGTVTPRDDLGWAILLNFLIYVVLPVPMRFVGVLLGTGSMLAYIITTAVLPKTEDMFVRQHLANGLLLITGALLGWMHFILSEGKHLRAFREAKKSLEVKMVIEEQSAEQERLLLSVLPEHVAVKMRQDLGSDDSEQFKKIYMSRHENVSILFADIVGFTAISSTYSAQDLVKMLNELFARFDRLAEKYHQLRIKILGDCYYCISGAPIERSDHAALCVHMGLSMVKAIKYVQQKTNSPVDMRVGIHTGAILAGILGQRQWQFDVYSKDVELANKMESSGKAGRVHISERTLTFLNNEFEVEPAFGEKREELLRIAGLKTYFIKKVLIPFTEPQAEENGTNGVSNGDAITSETPSVVSKDEDSVTHSIENGHVTTEEECGDKENDFKKRLKVELLSRDRHSELAQETNMLLSFNNEDLEREFKKHSEPMYSVPIAAYVLVTLNGTIATGMIIPSPIWYYLTGLLLPICLVPFVVQSVAEYFPSIFPSWLVVMSRENNMRVSPFGRYANTFLVAVLSITCSTMSIAICKYDPPINATTNLPDLEYTQNFLDHTPIVCQNFPSYFSVVAVLLLIATAVLTQYPHTLKIQFMIVTIVLYGGLNLFYLEQNFVREEYFTWSPHIPIGFSISAMLVAVAISLAHLARHMEKEDRVIFKWKTEVSEQKEKASDMRRRNEALVYNILPVHVAEHFMRNKARSYDELYSQSYDEVGVLFASMPNFSDFYSEDTVNNQGLECLRFLNEVISDFDALLEVARFQDVIKIKTISSTYMAASGLNPTRRVRPQDSIAVRWEHLALLVDFALELKKALQCINEQSFNHFVLKMGINHGPITAGVIGARKPHYDIWGNTVNVASRMESTGKAGAVQVTEETCNILQTFGYTFEQRGLVAVKGKGELMTYYLQGKPIRLQSSAHNSPMLTVTKPTETSPEPEATNDIQTTGESIQPVDSNCSTPSTKHKSQKCRTSEQDAQESDAIDPLANSPLLLQEKNSSNSNANDYNSADSEKDALIMSKTSSNF